MKVGGKVFFEQFTNSPAVVSHSVAFNSRQISCTKASGQSFEFHILSALHDIDDVIGGVRTSSTRLNCFFGMCSFH